ncbi:hypothetical protein HY68_01385 [Streptomyces sp. AcH 505]|uniref:hypothetical protein n=1 Tax=Streptomyces sp. AcH 505 TaxID=352211 RepID=UPI000591E2C9|nr:hypothetical protein HY68_01385 [Streptomyces sp. AcH 505]
MFGLTTTRKLRATQFRAAGNMAALGFTQGIANGSLTATRRKLIATQQTLELEAIARWQADVDLTAANHALEEVCTEILLERRQARRTQLHYRLRITHLLAVCAHRRTQARHLNGTIRLLAEQLLDATSGRNPAARQALGLTPGTPWERAVDGLNALTEAGVHFSLDLDGVLGPDGNTRIHRDSATGRWHLADTTETPAATVTTAPAALTTGQDDRR